MLRSVTRTPSPAVVPWGRVHHGRAAIGAHAATIGAHVSLWRKSETARVTFLRAWPRDFSTQRRATPESDSKKPKRKPTRPKESGVPGSEASDWRSLVAEFERRLHVQGKEAKVTQTDIFTIIKACAAHGRHREASSVVHRARLLGVEPSDATQAQMFALQAQKGNTEAAFEGIQKLLTSKTAETSVKIFDPLVQVLKEHNDWQSIRRAIQIMHDLKLEPPVRVFRSLVVAAARSNQKDVVIKTTQFLRTTLPEGSIDVATLAAVCQALTEVGEMRTVMDIYHETDAAWFEAHGNTVLFNNFVLAALRQGRLKKALEIFELMKVSEVFPPDDFTYATCMLEFEKREDWNQVIQFFNELQDRELKGISEAHAINSLSCAAVIRALHNREGASKRQTERDMQVILQRLDRVEVKQFGHCSSLLDALIEFNYRLEAQTLFKRMVQSGVVAPSWLRQNGFEVDLHSFSRGVATCAVVHAFQQLRSNAVLKKIDDMRIITGVGRRSKQYLQPVVPADVSELLIRCFRPLIRPMQHPTNPGALLVRTKAIREWLDGGAAIRYFE